MNPIRIGVMGCGVVADYGHIPAILYVDGLELTAVYDVVPEQSARTASKYGTRAAKTVEEFFDIGLDAVLVASSATAHLENVFACADHGLPVLCEKPLAMTDDDAQRMVNRMREAGLPLYTGFVYRASPVAQQIKRWVDEGAIGRVRSIRLPYLWNLHGRYERLPNGEWIESPRWRGRMLEGGPLVDCGVHQIDLARWWLRSEVIDWQVAAAWVADYEAPDHIYLHMDHACGAHTMVEMCFTYGHTARDPRSVFQYELIGDGGVIRYDREGWVLETITGAGNRRVPGESEKNFAELHKWFRDALRFGESGFLGTGEDGVIATKIARMATNQAIERRRSLGAPSHSAARIG